MRLATSLLLLALVAPAVSAQGLPPVWNFRNNFAIPDSPAYLLLETEPTDILRPETPRELAFALAKFQDEDGDFTLPKAIALEFSPLLLTVPNDLTIAQYQRKKLWYASRLSLATRLDSETGLATRLAAGYRLTMVDERTVGTDDSYRAELGVTEQTAQILEIKKQAIDRAQKAAFEQIDLEAEASEASSPASVRVLKLKWIDEHKDAQPALNAGEAEAVERLAKEIRRRFTERNWNATILDIAAGVRGTAADSTGRAMRLDAVAFWGSYAHRAGSTGQFLVAAKASYERDSTVGDMEAHVTLGSRYYVGGARAKAYGELELATADQGPARTDLGAGIEASFGDGVWVQLGVSRAQVSGESAQVVTTFKFKTAIPGL